MVSKFSMPFEFVISLAMVTQNPQFVLAVVNLVKDSKIYITIAESKTTTVTTTTDSYTFTGENENSETGEWEVVSQSDEQYSTSETNVTYSTKVFLSRANTWILNETTDLKYDDSTSEGAPAVTELEDYVNSYSSDGVGVRISHTNRKKSVQITVHNQRWQSSRPKVIEKTKNFIELILRESTSINGTGLVGIAKKCHDYVANNKWVYAEYGQNIPINLNEGAIDCSAYVSWVLYEAGYTEMEGWQHLASDDSLGFGTNGFATQKGWERIDNASDLQPGDICMFNGHINIFVGKDGGDFLFYDCGSTNSVQALEPISYSMTEFRYAARPNDEIAKKLSAENTVNLKTQIEEYLKTISDSKYSISVKALSGSSQSFTINDSKIKSEGLIKLYIMATVFNEMNKNDTAINKNDKYQEENILPTLRSMVQGDDNNATNQLLKTLGDGNIDDGIKKVNQYIKNKYPNTKLEGELSTDIDVEKSQKEGNEKTYTSPSDVTKILESIYNKKCVNIKYSEMMMELLKGQIYEDIIKQSIPQSEATVANKTGEQKGTLQDSAIISIENANYILVVMATDVNNTNTTKTNIQEISKIVYNYFLQTGSLDDNADNTAKDDEIDNIMNGKRVCYRMPGGGYECPLSNLVEGSDLLFELLQSSDKTQSHERLMRYLMYLLTGKDYGVTEFDFDEFLNGAFSSAGGIYGNTPQEKVWWGLLSMGFSKEQVAGAMGNIHYESGGFNPDSIEGGNGIGAGLCQWSFDRRIALEGYASSKGAAWSDVTIQVEFLMAELTIGGGANGFANYQLLYYNGFGPEDFLQATDVDYATKAFCWSFERPAIWAGDGSMSERIAWSNQYYNEFKDKKMPTATQYSDGTATSTQLKLQQIATSGNTFGLNVGWCQAWVYYVYKEAGLGANSSCCASSAAQKWMVSTDRNNIPIGATVYGNSVSGTMCECGQDAGHVGIYVGNGQVASLRLSPVVESLDSWMEDFSWKGWGWNGGVDASQMP